MAWTNREQGADFSIMDSIIMRHGREMAAIERKKYKPVPAELMEFMPSSKEPLRQFHEIFKQHMSEWNYEATELCLQVLINEGMIRYESFGRYGKTPVGDAYIIDRSKVPPM